MNNNQEHLQPYQFQPGQSGNPAGRPRSASIAAEIRRQMDEATTATLVRSIIKRALAGDMKAVQILLERVDGRTHQGAPVEFPPILTEFLLS